VRTELSDAEIVEIVLRPRAQRGQQRSRVSLGGDEAVVNRRGFEYYDVDVTGDVFADVDPADGPLRAATNLSAPTLTGQHLTRPGHPPPPGCKNAAFMARGDGPGALGSAGVGRPSACC